MLRSRFQGLSLAVGVLLTLAVVIGVALSPKVSAEESSSQRLISVSGEAEMKVSPDMATISFGVETQADTASAAQRQNASSMNKVISALLGKGIANKDMQTSDFHLSPVYEWQENRTRQVLVGYRCNNSLVVIVNDISDIGALIDAATNAGANTVGGLSFGVKDPSVYQDEMLAEAVKDARNKADVMAQAAGVTITGVYRISDGYATVQATRGSLKMMDMVESTSIEPGSVTIRASVRMDFSF